MKPKAKSKSKSTEPLLSIEQSARKVAKVKTRVHVMLLIILGGIALYLAGCSAHGLKGSVNTQARGGQTLSSSDVDMQQSQGPTSLETFNAFLDRS
jgi:hypothetical protein